MNLKPKYKISKKKSSKSLGDTEELICISKSEDQTISVCSSLLLLSKMNFERERFLPYRKCLGCDFLFTKCAQLALSCCTVPKLL